MHTQVFLDVASIQPSVVLHNETRKTSIASQGTRKRCISRSRKDAELCHKDTVPKKPVEGLTWALLLGTSRKKLLDQSWGNFREPQKDWWTGRNGASIVMPKMVSQQNKGMEPLLWMWPHELFQLMSPEACNTYELGESSLSPFPNEAEVCKLLF